MRIGDDDSHNLQEYTYKKITPCDVCSQVLRGEFVLDTHTYARQGDMVCLVGWLGCGISCGDRVYVASGQ